MKLTTDLESNNAKRATVNNPEPTETQKVPETEPEQDNLSTIE